MLCLLSSRGNGGMHRTDRQHKGAERLCSSEDVAEDAFIQRGKTSLGTRDGIADGANPLVLAEEE